MAIIVYALIKLNDNNNKSVDKTEKIDGNDSNNISNVKNWLKNLRHTQTACVLISVLSESKRTHTHIHEIHILFDMALTHLILIANVF